MSISQYMKWRALVVWMMMGLCAQAQLPDLIPILVSGRYGYCNPSLKVVIAPQFEDAFPFGPHGAIVKKDGHLGIIDANGAWTMPAVLDDIQVGRGLRLRRNGYYALANLDGCLLSDFDFEAIHELKNGYFMVERDGMRGLMDLQGRMVVPPRYDHVSQLRDNQGNYVELFATNLDNRQGIYDLCGDFMQAPRFSRIDVFQEGFAVVQENNRFGLIDIEGHLRVPCQYEQLQPMSEGLCAAKLKNRWGFINSDGREIIPFLYDAVQEIGFFQGRAAVSKAGNWGFINRAGEVDFPLDQGYQALGNLSEGMVAVCKLIEGGGVRYGYVDVEGRLKIGLRYDRAEGFKRGFAIVGLKQAKEQSVVQEMRYGVIDRNGRLVIPTVLSTQTQARLKRDSLGYLGFATLTAEGKTCRIDSKGHRFACVGNHLDALQRAWMSTRCENAELIAVSRDGLWGFCDRQGKLVIPCQYAAVQCFEGELARVWPARAKTNLSYYIDKAGRAYCLEPSAPNL